jgi:hypothetical protein
MEFTHPVIPFDVLDRIASFVQIPPFHPDHGVDRRDLAALRALRLTSRALRDVATAHLFRVVSWSTHAEDWGRLHRIANTPALASCVARLRYREWYCGRVRDADAYVESFMSRFPGLFDASGPHPVSVDALRRGYEHHRRRNEAQRSVVFTRVSDTVNLSDMKRLVDYIQKFPRLRVITIHSKPGLSPWLGPQVKYLKKGQENIAAIHSPGDENEEAVECFPRLVGRLGREHGVKDNLVFSWLVLRMLKLVLGVVHTPFIGSRSIDVEGDLFDFPFRMRDLTDILVDGGMGETALRTLDLNIKVEGGLDLAAIHGGVVELWLKQFPNIQRIKLQPSVGILPYTPLDVMHVKPPMYGAPRFRNLRQLTIWSSIVCSVENLLLILRESAKTLRTLEIDHLGHYEWGELILTPSPPGDDSDDGNANANANPNAGTDFGIESDTNPMILHPETASDSSGAEHYPHSPARLSDDESDDDDDDDIWHPGQYRSWDSCDPILREIASLGLQLEHLTVFPESYMRYRISSVMPVRDAVGYTLTGKAEVARFLAAGGGARIEGRQETTIMINDWRVRVFEPRPFPDFLLG